MANSPWWAIIVRRSTAFVARGVEIIGELWEQFKKAPDARPVVDFAGKISGPLRGSSGWRTNGRRRSARSGQCKPRRWFMAIKGAKTCITPMSLSSALRNERPKRRGLRRRSAPWCRPRRKAPSTTRKTETCAGWRSRISPFCSGLRPRCVFICEPWKPPAFHAWSAQARISFPSRKCCCWFRLWR